MNSMSGTTKITSTSVFYIPLGTSRVGKESMAKKLINET